MTSNRKLPTAQEYHLRGCFFVSAALVVMLIGAGVTIACMVWMNDQSHIGPPGYSGDPKRGRNLVAAYGCASCHTVSGASPQGLVGPPLDEMARRSYIAGRYANEEIRMTQWLQHPQSLQPGTAMPDLNIGERDARDLAAYLATLR